MKKQTVASKLRTHYKSLGFMRRLNQPRTFLELQVISLHLLGSTTSTYLWFWSETVSFSVQNSWENVAFLTGDLSWKKSIDKSIDKIHQPVQNTFLLLHASIGPSTFMAFNVEAQRMP
jgi:hypothetical protein